MSDLHRAFNESHGNNLYRLNELLAFLDEKLGADDATHAKQLLGAIVSPGYSARLYSEAANQPPALPPENVTVPAVTGTGEVGAVLSCTMGEWNNVPTSYAYAWSNGAAIGTDANTYTVVSGDAGKSITCTVTATNDYGSTAAPPSNSIDIAPEA